ncbi:helix-turn-helix domain-containing protein [Teredinibacter purpureus]|uniref:helix-turn-helix domain-containing protein n=1 Tax=Teredinibacter purpureus TaxID=2731756 RepID=UPI0005F7FFF3|nr:helix-turn-helix transcriptional regulator [Teredinibacter purpureus]
MTEIVRICDTLKRLLREKKLTYRALSVQLSMSEANVKRMFSQHSFSLKRLEEICAIVGIAMSDLFSLAEKASEKLEQLTQEQEKELVANLRLCLVAVCVRDGWSFSDIVQQYAIEALECTRLLAHLDRLKMIELLPENRYRVLIAQNFRWIPSGPLERFITRDVISKFISAPFDEPESFRFYLRGSYSASSISHLKRRLSQLTREAADLNEADAKRPLEERQHIGVMLAMRPWELSLFQALRRDR